MSITFTFDPSLTVENNASIIAPWSATITELPMFCSIDNTPDRIFWTDAAATGFDKALSVGSKFILTYAASLTGYCGTALYRDGAVTRPVRVSVTTVAPDIIELAEFELGGSVLSGTDLSKIVGPLFITYELPATVIYNSTLQLPLRVTDLHDTLRADPCTVHIGDVNPLLAIRNLHIAINNIERCLGLSPTPWSGGLVAEQVSFDPVLYPFISNIYASHINEMSTAVMRIGTVCAGLGYPIVIESYADWTEHDILPLFGDAGKPGLADLINDVNTIERILKKYSN